MAIKKGDRLPDVLLKRMSDDGPAEFSISKVSEGRKIVIVGLTGAFTTTCHNTHIPGYLENLETLKGKGVDEIIIVSVNDHNVMGAWGEALNADGKLTFAADFDAEFTKQIGMDIDLAIAGLGLRSKRYAMIVDDGIVTDVSIDEGRGVVDESGAAAVMEKL
ncbi:MAG: peroxiredoxin [Rhizobiaceae bacterium]